MMYVGEKQEQCSRAYVQLIATVAGYRVLSPAEPGDEGVDLTIATPGPQGTTRAPRVDVLLRSLQIESVPEEPWSFPIKVRHYDSLRSEHCHVPRILVVMALPRRVQDFIEQTEAGLTLRHCAYWLSLRGQPQVDAVQLVTLRLARSQVFCVEHLNSMMARIAEGGTP